MKNIIFVLLLVAGIVQGKAFEDIARSDTVYTETEADNLFATIPSNSYAIVDTVAELKLVSPDEFIRVTVHGYWPFLTATNHLDTSGAYNGGGSFLFDTTTNYTANGGTVIAGIGGNWIREYDRNKSEVNASWFGAIGYFRDHVPTNSFPDWVATTNNYAISNALANARMVDFDNLEYPISAPIIMKTRKVMKGIAVQGALSRIIADDSFVGAAMVLDYTTLPASTYLSWRCENMHFTGAFNVDWIVQAAAWNEDSGMYSCRFEQANFGNIWVRGDSEGFIQNWSIEDCDFFYTPTNGNFCNILVDRVISRCLIDSSTFNDNIIIYEPTGISAQAIIDSISVTNGYSVNAWITAMNTTGAVGVIIGPGNGEIAINNCHAEDLDAFIVAIGDNSVLIQNSNLLTHEYENLIFAAIGENVNNITIISSHYEANSVTNVFGFIYNEHPDSFVNDFVNGDFDRGYIGHYYWNKSGVELSDYRTIQDNFKVHYNDVYPFLKGIPAAELSAAFDFDYMSDPGVNGLIRDYSGAGNTGTNRGIATYTGDYALFGITNTVTFPTSLLTNITIVAEVFLNTNANYSTIFSENEANTQPPAQGLSYRVDQRLVYRHTDGTADNLADITTGEGGLVEGWHRIVLRDVDSVVHIWIDGESVSLSPSNTMPVVRYPSSQMSIGSYRRNSSWDGKPIGVRYFRRVDEGLSDDACLKLSKGYDIRNL